MELTRRPPNHGNYCSSVIAIGGVPHAFRLALLQALALSGMRRSKQHQLNRRRNLSHISSKRSKATPERRQVTIKRQRPKRANRSNYRESQCPIPWPLGWLLAAPDRVYGYEDTQELHDYVLDEEEEIHVWENFGFAFGVGPSKAQRDEGGEYHHSSDTNDWGRAACRLSRAVSIDCSKCCQKCKCLGTFEFAGLEDLGLRLLRGSV